MKSVSFSVCFGVVPGYQPDADHPSPEAAVVAAWSDAMDAEFDQTGVVIGAVISAARVIYPRHFGCPVLGEAAARVEGTSNPEFCDAGRYRAAVKRVVQAVKAALHQERVTLVFTPVSELAYIIPERERLARQRGIA